MTSKPTLRSVMEHYVHTDVRRMVPCPLHGDRTPSCSVNLDKGVWNCHSCGKGGDAWTLIQLMEGVDFLGAVSFAEEAKFPTEEGDGEEAVIGNRWTGASSAPKGRGRDGKKRVYRPKFRRGDD